MIRDLRPIYDHIWPVLLPIIFFTYSMPIFLDVYNTTQVVVDEQYHLWQGLNFCRGNYTLRSSKITTFPGLYLFTLVLNPLGHCTIMGLRLISLSAASFNVALMYLIRRPYFRSVETTWNAVDAITIAVLPPLYFFSHVYYTDVLSLTTVLLLCINWHDGDHLRGSIWGAISVLMRQTNIVWVVMVVGITALDVLIKNYSEWKRIRPENVKLYEIKVILEILSNSSFICRCILFILKDTFLYIFGVLLPFISFVYVNGSIAMGDKEAHVVSLHMPQILYFSVFCLFFALSNTINQLCSAVRLILKNKMAFIFVTAIFFSVVKRNSLVHPYMLADNRHYTFYIWNRFYQRYVWFRYAMCPVYVFALVVVYQGIKHLKFSYRFMFWLSAFMFLCFQRLIEFRYFLIPYVLFRLNIKPNLRYPLIRLLELVLHVGINIITFHIFFTKEVIWKDYMEPQRIIW